MSLIDPTPNHAGCPQLGGKMDCVVLFWCHYGLSALAGLWLSTNETDIIVTLWGSARTFHVSTVARPT